MTHLFIINPISGGRKADALRAEAEAAAKTIPGAALVRTQRPAHARELALKAAEEGVGTVVAVGGDGTVNEVASALVGRESALGIVPIGSGNGLARHLGIPMRPRDAVERLREAEAFLMDTATIDGRPFFCTAGVGFDAKVASDYAASGRRGLVTYVRTALRDFRSYAPAEYVIETDGGVIRTRALLVTCGNANQWGNNCFITPDASLQDGRLDVAIVMDAPLLAEVAMVPQLLHKSLAHNRYVSYLKTSFARVEMVSEGTPVAHFDGEVASGAGKSVEFRCLPASLRVAAL